MAPDDNSGARPVGPVVLRIKLRYDDVATMVQRFAPNVGKSGLFLPTKSIQPIGTEVKFELRLSNDQPVLVGLGRVKHVKSPDPANPKAAFGMAIELMRVSREGREVIIKMIERRRAMGLADVAIPVPDDVDAARRSEVESQPRADTSGIVREAMAQFASAPVAEQVLSAPPSGPIAVAKAERGAAAAPVPTAEPAAVGKTEFVPVPMPEPAAAAPVPTAEPAAVGKTEFVPVPMPEPAAAAPLMTAPRESGPIPRPATDGSSGRRSVPVLAPETAKARRPRMADLIAKASELSGPLAAASVPGLDEDVDLGRAFARARALAGSDLEGELAALRDASAAPLEINIEAASAELARQLGGKPIAKRDRSAKWVPPPAVEVRAERVAPVPEPEPERDATPEPPHDAALARDAAPARDAESAHDATPEPATPEPATPEPATPEPPHDAAPAGDADAELARDATLEPEVVSDFVAKTRAETEASPSTVLASVTNDPQVEQTSYDHAREADREPAVAALPIESVAPTAAPAAAPAPDDDDPVADYAVDEKTRIPSGDDYVNSLLPSLSMLPEPDVLASRDRRSFSNIDEEQLRTEPGQLSGVLIDDHADAASIQRALEGSQPAMPLADDDIEAIGDDDAGEQTEIGAMPTDPNAFSDHGYPTVADQLADQLDRQLAEAEAEADDDFRELADAPAPAHDAYAIKPYSDHRYDEGAEPQPYDARQYDGRHYDEQQHQQHQRDFVGAQDYDNASIPEDAGGEEISDFDVLAEADEADADLLSAHGEVDVVHGGSPVAESPAEDFAARLDLDDDDPAAEFDERHHFVSTPRFAPTTLGEDFDEPHAFSQNTPVPVPGRPRATAPARAASPAPESLRYAKPAAHSEDLEDALAALDVDIDDGPHRRRSPRTSGSAQRPLPGLPVHRTGEVPLVERPRTGANAMIKPAPEARTTSEVRTLRPQTSENRNAKPPTMPPPIPSAARKTHTTPPPIPIRQAPQRATTDDGVLIDFDDDE